MQGIVATGKTSTNYQKAFNLMVEFLSDCNPKWGQLVKYLHKDSYSIERLVESCFELGRIDGLPKGIMIQMSPFQKGVDTAFIRKMVKKYNVRKTPVTFTVKRDGKDVPVTTKKPVLIGAEYWYLLYKTPKVKCSGVGYVNQYHSPVHASNLAKLQYAFSQTPIRLGEDEIRNLTLVAGSETAARILGLYANSHNAVTNLSEHLMFDKKPSDIKRIDMDTKEIVQTNAIMGVTKHIFASFGVDITPSSSQTLQVDLSTGDMYMPVMEG